MAIPCYYMETLPKDVDSVDFPEKYVFPDFTVLESAETSPKESPLEVRGAWNAEGLAFQFRLVGQQKMPFCRANQLMLSDRVELWLDTRDVRNVHRATKFCHGFALMPLGGGEDGQKPMFFSQPINRAKEHPNDIPRGSVSISSRIIPQGYVVTVHLSAKALTGYYPDEFPRLGIAWAVYDRTLGEITLTSAAPFPFREDPSLWFTLELVR